MTLRPFSVATSERAVALDVADVDQALDDRRARGRRADAGVLHRLAQLVVVDELAGGLHRAQQRGVGVAPRRLGLLLLGARRRACRPPRPLRASAAAGRGPRRRRRLSRLGVGPRRRRRASRARAGPCRGCGRRARRPSSPRACSRTRPRDGRRRGSAARPCRRCGGRRRSACRAVVLGVRRDDRVVVGDLGVVDHAAERQHVERRDVRRGPRVLAAARRRCAAIGLISGIMSVGRKRELVRG